MILQYQQKTKVKTSEVTNELNGTSVSWTEVREAVQQAKARETGRDNDSWSARNHCDKIVDNISSFETWLELLPSGDYGAVVSGVFKMVVTVSLAAFPLEWMFTSLGC